MVSVAKGKELKEDDEFFSYVFLQCHVVWLLVESQDIILNHFLLFKIGVTAT